MRTTLTLDRDVAERLRQEIRRSGRGLKAVVNEALRQGLGMGARRGKAKAFVVETFDLRVRPGVDPDRMNQLVDALEVAERVKKYEP
jgi:hypothetical protein